MVVVTTQTTSRASHVTYLRSLIADMDHSRLNSSANLHSIRAYVLASSRDLTGDVGFPRLLRRGVSPR